MGQTVSMEDVSGEAIAAVGIDVAKASLVVGLWRRGATPVTLSLGNTETDVRRLGQALTGFAGRIVCESTGSYHLLSAVILTELGYDVRVINPLLTTKYTRAAIRKVKTDRQDAIMLAELAYKEESLPAPFATGGRAELLLKRKLSLMQALDRQLQSLGATLHAYRATLDELGGTPSKAEQSLEESYQELRKARRALETEVITLGRSLTPVHQTTIDRFVTIPGISSYVATLAALYFGPAYHSSPKQWVAFAGLDVSVRESGQWQGRGKLTKRGNRYLRKRLFSAAWGAVMHDAAFKDWYTHLKQAGRHHFAALNIIARKLIRIMFALTQSQTDYDPTKPLWNHADTQLSTATT